jgi:hypothetical protein
MTVIPISILYLDAVRHKNKSSHRQPQKLIHFYQNPSDYNITLPFGAFIGVGIRSSELPAFRALRARARYAGLRPRRNDKAPALHFYWPQRREKNRMPRNFSIAKRSKAL